jgi:hypothetical protein
MRRAPEHRVDDSAVGTVGRVFTDRLGWMFTRNEVREYGIDGHAQAVRGDLVTGRMLATQIKGGASRFRRPVADGSGWVFWADNNHLHYWLGYHVPVLVVLVRPGDGAAFWQVIRPSTVTEHARGFTMVIPAGQRLDGPAGDQLLAIAADDQLIPQGGGHVIPHLVLGIDSAVAGFLSSTSRGHRWRRARGVTGRAAPWGGAGLLAWPLLPARGAGRGSRPSVTSRVRSPGTFRLCWLSCGDSHALAGGAGPVPLRGASPSPGAAALP